MVALSASGERKFARYKQQDIDAAYIGGQKIFGKNLWRFRGAGANDYGTTTVEIMDGYTAASNNSQHYKFTVTGTASNIWSRLLQNLYYGGTATSYDMNKDYTTSFWVKPSLNKIRVYVYMGAVSNNPPATAPYTNWTNVLVEVVPNQWNFIQLTRKPASPDAATSNRSLLGIRYLQSDHVGVNLIGQTLEVKEIKTEEGELSPYSVHSSLL